MNAIERLREFTECPNIDIDAALHSGCVYCAAREERGIGEALAAVDALYQAAKARVQRGHDDTCSYELDDAQHSNGYVCDCGHDALAAAVRRVEGE